MQHHLTQQLMKSEGKICSKEMVVRGGSLERLIPVLMTATCETLGLLPIALSASQPGKKILQVMAIVMLAGLVSSTFLVLFYTPAFFWHWCGPIVEKLIGDSSKDRWQ